jgi:hypothetical protein
VPSSAGGGILLSNRQASASVCHVCLPWIVSGGMNRHSVSSVRAWMAVVVVAHLAASLVHGAAHGGAHVTMSAASNLFVWVVILAGPAAGLAISWRAARIGGLIVALTMAGSLVFGVANHFVFESPDHISHVAEPWRRLFGTTAVLLAITEALGCGLALRLVRVGRAS